MCVETDLAHNYKNDFQTKELTLNNLAFVYFSFSSELLLPFTYLLI